MNRGLEKNNEGERFTKQETKKSGEISDAFRIWQRKATSEGLGAKPPAAGGYGDLGALPPASNGFLGFLQKNSHFSEVFLSILTTRLGIHTNRTTPGPKVGPWYRGPPCVRQYGPSIFFNEKKLKSSHGRPTGLVPGGGCPPFPLVTPLRTGTHAN